MSFFRTWEICKKIDNKVKSKNKLSYVPILEIKVELLNKITNIISIFFLLNEPKEKILYRTYKLKIVVKMEKYEPGNNQLQ